MERRPGFIIVPREPTEAMVRAGVIACVAERDHLADEGVQEIYRAMIDAALTTTEGR